MGLRPGNKHNLNNTEGFWKLFLETEKYLPPDQCDRCRRLVFDYIAEPEVESKLKQYNFAQDVLNSISAVANISRAALVEKLFLRITRLNTAHRQILLKAASEWVVARYWRGMGNYERQHKLWLDEKSEWEAKPEHIGLTEEIRNEFNNIFGELEIKDKKPRICDWERLKGKKDDCLYNGDKIKRKSHSQLCVKYYNFCGDKKKEGRFNDKFFLKHASTYIGLRKYNKSKKDAIEKILRNDPKAGWFQKTWDEYLKALNINEDTIIKDYGTLPHCIKFAADKDCQFNKHTEKCIKYRDFLEKKPELQGFDKYYRKWRSEYLRGPRKPSFQYPSKRNLPMPKIFGNGYFQIEWENSILKLRLDDMPEGEYVNFGFTPWPKDYKPEPQNADITSVHISFIGTRARIGFHFNVNHKESRFAVSQDEIDDLRSRAYPRHAQDQLFLDEARKRLSASFQGNPEKDLKIMTK